MSGQAVDVRRAALEQRDDVARLNATLKGQLAGKGLTFADTDKASFRRALSRAGFYREWQGKLGGEAWDALQPVVGPRAGARPRTALAPVHQPRRR